MVEVVLVVEVEPVVVVEIVVVDQLVVEEVVVEVVVDGVVVEGVVHVDGVSLCDGVKSLLGQSLSLFTSVTICSG